MWEAMAGHCSERESSKEEANESQQKSWLAVYVQSRIMKNGRQIQMFA